MLTHSPVGATAPPSAEDDAGQPARVSRRSVLRGAAGAGQVHLVVHRLERGLVAASHPHE